MAVEIVMPRMSDTMESGTITRWLKHEGQDVKKGEPIAEIETDKATMQLESYAGGTLQQILLKEGQSAPIGTPIAVIGAAGGAPTGKPSAPPAAPAAPSPGIVKAETTPPSPVPEAGRILASPIARRLAEEMNIDLRGVTGT
ncbi:MAG: biotin/lipoyl-containing protein, partial [Chloroflexota bacterium]